MTTVIDRRLNPHNKSLGNRQRFIRRAKDQIKKAVSDAINNANIGGAGAGKNKVSVPIRGVDEPILHDDSSTGDRDMIVPGNERFTPGDKIAKPQSGGGGAGSGTKGGKGLSEDAFEFVLTYDEFLEFFFEDLELPNMVTKAMKSLEKFTMQRSGFRKHGSPAQLSIKRTALNALGRRIALRRPKKQDIELLDSNFIEELENLELQRNFIKDASIEVPDDELAAALDQIDKQEKIIIALREDRVGTLRKRQRAIPWIDTTDLRFRNFTPKPKPITQAVMFCLMDVSGSMGEREKNIAKRFFILLNILLSKKYRKVEIVFVRHHETAMECDEHDFFHLRESGGTLVSSGLDFINNIIKTLYNVSDWNIYVSQASDGDNFTEDEEGTLDAMRLLLPKTQYFAYLEVEREFKLSAGADRALTELWQMYEKIAEEYPHLSMSSVGTAKEIWTVFQKLFAKAKV